MKSLVARNSPTKAELMTIQQNSRDITPIQNKTIDHSKLPKINISNINLKSQEHQNFNFQLKNQINESEDIKTPHIVAKIQNLKARNNSIDPDSPLNKAKMREKPCAELKHVKLHPVINGEIRRSETVATIQHTSMSAADIIVEEKKVKAAETPNPSYFKMRSYSRPSTYMKRIEDGSKSIDYINDPINENQLVESILNEESKIEKQNIDNIKNTGVVDLDIFEVCKKEYK